MFLGNAPRQNTSWSDVGIAARILSEGNRPSQAHCQAHRRAAPDHIDSLNQGRQLVILAAIRLEYTTWTDTECVFRGPRATAAVFDGEGPAMHEKNPMDGRGLISATTPRRDYSTSARRPFFQSRFIWSKLKRAERTLLCRRLRLLVTWLAVQGGMLMIVSAAASGQLQPRSLHRSELQMRSLVAHSARPTVGDNEDTCPPGQPLRPSSATFARIQDTGRNGTGPLGGRHAGPNKVLL